MLTESTSPVAPSHSTKININLYCGIYAALGLNIRLSDVVSAIKEEAESLRNNDEEILNTYEHVLTRVTASQIFCMLSVVNRALTLNHPTSYLARLAAKVEKGCRLIYETTEELTSSSPLEESVMGHGRFYDEATCAVYMLLHAWSWHHTFKGPGASPFETRYQQDEGLHELVVKTNRKNPYGMAGNRAPSPVGRVPSARF